MGYISDIRKKVGHDPVFMPASGCLIIKDNKILLQKRTDNGKWAMHGGALDLGETFEEALIREVKEELNIQVINPKLINVYSGEDIHLVYPNNDEVYGISALYLVTNYLGEIKIDQTEVEEVKWFDIDDIPNEIHKPDQKALKDIIDYYKKQNKEMLCFKE